MDVRLGWSGEVHGVWTKMDVEVNDADFLALLAEKGVEIPENRFVPPLMKFKLMYSIAETFVQLHKMTRYPEVFGRDEDKEELRELLATQATLIEGLK